MSQEEIQNRLDEIDQELVETQQLQRSNRPSIEDMEDMSDNYQMNIEWNYYIDELHFERS